MSNRDDASAAEPRFAPLCIWCSAPWSDKNLSLEAYASMGCETCGPEVEAKVTITCHECKRVMYQKENNGYDY